MDEFDKDGCRYGHWVSFWTCRHFVAHDLLVGVECYVL